MRRWFVFALIWIVSLIPFQVSASDKIKVHLGLLGAGEQVFAYEISVLKLALAHCGRDAELEIEVLTMPQERAFLELESGRSSFNVFFSGFSAEREARFRQIDIPLSRGLLGHRIFITTDRFAAALAEIGDLDTLKQFAVVGSGNGWPDTRIFEAAGFSVQRSRYENLWKMLAKERINIFNRGIHEAYVEIGIRKPEHQNLVVDPHLMVRYRFDYMFYVQKDNEELGDLLETGLRRAYESGAFMENFNSHPMIRTVIEQAHPKDRLTFDIDNPLMTERQRAIPDRYWHSF
ncbi:transporter substrate-binding domain-containing protein [Roseibium sediminicola]|uniref:Transporter substrate-binding domain-containing protein n=1 Tax=Roseibium sediminicola TaxID=2933272 RepID=A0ABT0GQ85_9HYPH|nr:transporter substrate-binding domain-containing protein [Roseibium sp. CAU 1639]MCK7611597.1 transporter substrate-binding domain-containing protein [Roseibium sp. CAU 1639]